MAASGTVTHCWKRGEGGSRNYVTIFNLTLLMCNGVRNHAYFQLRAALACCTIFKSKTLSRSLSLSLSGKLESVQWRLAFVALCATPPNQCSFIFILTLYRRVHSSCSTSSQTGIIHTRHATPRRNVHNNTRTTRCVATARVDAPAA